MESSGEKIPIGPGKVSKRDAKSVLVELSSRGLESFLTHGYAQLSRWLLNIRNLSLCFSTYPRQGGNSAKIPHLLFPWS